MYGGLDLASRLAGRFAELHVWLPYHSVRLSGCDEAHSPPAAVCVPSAAAF